MKHFFLFIYLLTASPISAQHPIQYFSKSRCQKVPKTIIPFSEFPLQINFDQLILEKIHHSAISVWEQKDNTLNAFPKTEKHFTIEQPGFYLVIIIDPIAAQLIEYTITENEMHIQQYKHCAIHY